MVDGIKENVKVLCALYYDMESHRHSSHILDKLNFELFCFITRNE